MSKLSSFLKTKLEAWVPFEGFDGFEVKLAYLSRDELNKIRIACTRTSFNPKTRQKEETVDSELFVKAFVGAAVLDWKGFTLEHATKLLPIEVPADVDLASTIDYSPEDALALAKDSSVFDGWLNDTIFDLEMFRTRTT